jgi:lysophospholipase L1-like esterase
VAGDAAADALVRFDQDVAVHRPDYVTVLLGMNDGRYEDFSDETFAAYQSSMRQLMDRIESIGAEAIVLSPTMFDHAVAQRRRDDPSWRFRDKQHSPHYNALMAFFGGWCLDEARRRQLPFVNLWAPLNTYTIQARRGDPDFTLIADAIHPQASGHVVMAFEILSQLDVQPRAASSIVISRRGSGWVASPEVQDLQVSEDGTRLTFTQLAKSLPWVVPEKHATKSLRWQLPSDGRVGYAITKAGHKLSADRIKIAGLPPGTYEILIDGVSIGTWNQIALGTRVELQQNPRTPQHQQALRVAQLNRQRHDDAVRPMRDKWGTIKGLRRRYASDREKREALISDAMTVIETLQAKAQEMEATIRQASVPVPHRWEIRSSRQDP